MRRFDGILIAGHRGAAALYPENTRIGFQAAVDMGCDMIETDLRLTRDGHIVLMHDATVDRTSDGSGVVADMTLDELRKLDIGSRCLEFPGYKGERPEAQRIMTFLEFCEMMKPTPLLLNIEFKEKSEECIDKAMCFLRERRMTGRCVFTSFHPSVIAYCHDAYGVRVQGFPKEYFKEGFTEETYAQMYSVGIGMKDLSSKSVQEFIRLGIHPWAWCPDDEESVKRCIECGAELITCNDPRPALRLLR